MSSSSFPQEGPRLRQRLPSTGSARSRSPASQVLLTGSDFSRSFRRGSVAVAPPYPDCVSYFAPLSHGRHDCAARTICVTPPAALASNRGDPESSQVPVKPLCACPALRPRRTVRASLSRRVQCCLPLRKPRRLRVHFPFEAQSRGLRTPCVRLAAEVALEPRNTRSQPVATPLPGQDSHLRVSPEGFDMLIRSTYHPPSPGLTWRTFSGNVIHGHFEGFQHQRAHFRRQSCFENQRAVHVVTVAHSSSGLLLGFP